MDQLPKVTVNILTYNIMEPVPEPIRYYGQKERTMRVKDVIRNIDEKYHIDVVVLNEVVALPAQKVIFRDMEEIGFVHHTSKLMGVLSVTGGILLFSKHPITQEEISTFGDKCTGIDCFAAKGVVYARMKKENLYFNVLGTHMQAWPSMASQIVRDAQTEQVAKFIQSINIPRDEPVMFCGDFNIDLYENNDILRHLLHRLDMDMPEIHEDSHPFTVDPKENKMVGNDDPSEYQTEEWPEGCVEVYYESLECPCCPAEWIDYALYSKKHLAPISSYMMSIAAKVPPFRMKINISKHVEIEDVSDHFPLLGHFVFDASGQAGREKRDTLSKDNAELSSNTSHVAFVVVIIVLVVIIFLGIAWISFVRWWPKKSASTSTISADKSKRTRLKSTAHG